MVVGVSAPSIDPELHRAVREAPVLAEPHARALGQFADLALPRPRDTTAYHLDLARLFACFFGGQLEKVMAPRPKRNVDLAGYQADLSLLAFGQSVCHLLDITGNTDLVDAPNGGRIADVLAARHEELARPLRAQISGRDRVSVESITASMVRKCVKRNKLRTKTEAYALALVIPSALVATRTAAAAHVHRTPAELLAPLMTDDPPVRL
jgi:hypothetical protein